MNKKTALSTISLLFLVQSSLTYCSEQPAPQKSPVAHSKKTDGAGKPPFFRILACCTVVAWALSGNWSFTPQNLPTNPVEKINRIKTVNTNCFSYSQKSSSGMFMSNVYQAESTQEAVEDILRNNPDAILYWLDCRYYSRSSKVIQN